MPAKRASPLPPFAELTPRGQARRLRALALLALTHYEYDVHRVTLLANHHNGVFRVDLADGSRRILRVSHPTWRSDADLHAELFWLAALACDAPDIGAPLPLPNRDGSLITRVSGPGVPEQRRCVLFSWVPGQPPAARLTQPAVVRSIGMLVARLHEHATHLAIPPDLPVQRYDRIFMHSEELPRDWPDTISGLEPAARHTLRRAIHAADATFRTLLADQAAWHVINADLWQANILLHRGQPLPVDFEDTMLGHPAQDIALLCYDLLFYAERQGIDDHALVQEFIDGYATVRPWPVQDGRLITGMMLVRRIWTVHWVLTQQPPSVQAAALPRIVARLAQLLQRLEHPGTA